MSDLLFTSFPLGSLTLKNRLTVAPLATRYATGKGEITNTMISYYAHLAMTGVALIVAEAAVVSAEGRGWSNQLGIYDDDHVEGLRQIAEAIRERGSIPLLQLHHAGRQGLPASDGTTIGPSPIPCPVLSRPVKEMTADEVREMIRKFAVAARRAQSAGFVGVELHGAHGYLIHQFNSPLTNFREDEYGLGTAGYSTFGPEIVRSIKAIAPELVITYRLSARDYLPCGLRLKDSKHLVQALVREGVDGISVSGGMYASLHGRDSLFGPHAPMAVFREDAAELRKVVPVPIILTGKVQYPGLARELIEQGDAHLIGLGRMILRDPDWLAKARGESVEPIRPCLLCSRCRFHQKGCPDGAVHPVWTL
jgi:2,4-dienoyl-CoA reductase-like NADH-dependent reductase (Old Yellow Enzyme family)